MRWKFIFRVSRDNSLAQGLRRRRGFHLIRGGPPHPSRFAAHLSRLPARSALLSLRSKVSTGDPRPSKGKAWGTARDARTKKPPEDGRPPGRFTTYSLYDLYYIGRPCDQSCALSRESVRRRKAARAQSSARKRGDTSSAGEHLIRPASRPTCLACRLGRRF